jgi:molybdopterin molybdotransferase
MSGPRALSVDDALRAILAEAAPIDAWETVSLFEAPGRLLAAPLAARLTQPPFDASAMDGYAVRAADVGALPATLTIIGEAAAGHGFGGLLGAGQAVRIFTGAPVPAGADAIVIQENTRRDGTTLTVLDGRPDAEHIRPRGGDFAAGQPLLESGRRLTARDITLAAAMGHATLPVRRRPIVALLATGDELVLPGTAPAADQIVCSNPFGVAALLAAAGAEPRFLGIARDDRTDLAAHVALARDADVLITLGGASVGDHDLVGPVLREAGMTLAFWKIAMRPGKPLMFGRLGPQAVLGLPGNPVSSLICTRLFAVPLVHALLGLEAAEAAPGEAVTAVPLAANGPRAHYMRARSTWTTDGRRCVTPVRSQDSSLLSPLLDADVLVVRPIGAPALSAGATVPVLPLDL